MKEHEEFTRELKELLKKYNADISLDEIGARSYSRGEDHIVINFNSIWNSDNDNIRPSSELDLGRYIYAEDNIFDNDDKNKLK